MDSNESRSRIPVILEKLKILIRFLQSFPKYLGTNHRVFSLCRHFAAVVFMPLKYALKSILSVSAEHGRGSQVSSKMKVESSVHEIGGLRSSPAGMSSPLSTSPTHYLFPLDVLLMEPTTAKRDPGWISLTNNDERPKI